MRTLRTVAMAAALGYLGLGAQAEAQVSIHIGVPGLSVNVGPQPVCPYGYFDYAPYGCAPYGYYGPEWFTGGVFIGAGPWFHGDPDFHGHVDSRYDPRRGYRGPLPARGEHRDPDRRIDHMDHFRGDERHDGRGHWDRDRDHDHGHGHGHGDDHDHGHGHGHDDERHDDDRH